MSSISNKSKYIVRVKGHPDLKKTFPHNKAAEAEAYRDQLVKERPELKAETEIERGPLKLLVRIRTKGRPIRYKTVHSYDEAEAFEITTRADEIRGLASNPSRRTTLAQFIVSYIAEVCVKHKGREIEVCTLQGLLADSRGELIRARQAFKDAKERGENPKPVKARRHARTDLEWLHLPLEDLTSAQVERFKEARLKQVAPATVDRELDLISAVIHWAIDERKYKVVENPMTRVERPKYENDRDRRLEDDEQERLFRSARREDLIHSRAIALEGLLVEARERAKNAKNASARTRFLKRARRRAIKHLRRRYPIVPLHESFIAFLLETACRRSEALKLRWCDVNFKDETAFFPKTKNGFSRTVPVQRFSLDLLKSLPRSDERVFPLTRGEVRRAWERIGERAGLRERNRTNKKKCSNDFHEHDLRHEGISRIAEAGRESGQSFTILDLQAITGHRDLTSLARYFNPKAKKLSRHLNRVFADAGISPDGGHRARLAHHVPRIPVAAAASNVIPFPGTSCRRGPDSHPADPGIRSVGALAPVSIPPPPSKV
jgi:integrase